MKKLKVIVKDKTTLMLEESGQIGDIIDLTNLMTIDQNPILEAIKRGTDTAYTTYFEMQAKHLEMEHELEITRVKNALTLETQTLKEQLAALQANKEAAITIAKQEAELAMRHEIDVKEHQIAELKHQLDQNEGEHRLQLEYHVKTHELDLVKLEKEQLLKTDNLVAELEVLRRERAMRNVKKIGEDLEGWCYEQFKTVSIFGFKTSTFEKDNEVMRLQGETKGTKGDYIFKVYSIKEPKTLLTSAMIEMKSEALESEHKKRNQDHYKKLDEDRRRKGLEYAILISELEYNTEADAPIFIVPDYDNMLVVRPAYFITLLGIIESIGLKYSELVTKRELEKISFKDAQMILDDFREFKDNLLENSLKNIAKQLEMIKDKAMKIASDANAILQATNIITTTHLETVINKINNFSIQIITKRIERHETAK